MPTGKQIRRWLNENHPDALLMDGYDDCIIGVAHQWSKEPIVAYDREKVINKLVSKGMSYSEAVEFHEFNQEGAWVGEKTPCFVDLPVIIEPVKRKKK